MRRLRRRGDGGQALVEFALSVPVLLLLVMLTLDLGRAFWQDIDGAGASRAGARMGIISDTSDIGDAVRNEPNSGIPNTVAAWGSVGPGQSAGTCTASGSTCGDSGGCAASSFVGAQYACFAIRTCTLSSGGDLGSCVSFGSWGFRPETGGGHGLQVKVVIKFSPVTPALGRLLGGSGVIYLTQVSTAEELYF